MSWTGDPVWLAQVLRAEGLDVAEYPGCYQRGHGDMRTIWGVIDHHTGATGSPGPGAIANHPTLGLCSQLHLARNGKLTVCGVGIAWHAGRGSWPGLPANGANEHTIGIEAENNGTEGWGPAQYWAYVKANAAILRKLGYGADRSIGHKEWAGAAQGKWDPGNMNLAKFRADIADHLAGRIAPPPVENQIDRIAGFSPWLGARRHAGEHTTPDGRGRFVEFAHGTVYWMPDTGAIPVPTHVLEAYAARGYETGTLGYPARYHTVIPHVGDIQGFQGGVIYRPYGQPGHVVHGAVLDRYASMDYERGELGWPVGDEVDHRGGRMQHFQIGQLHWHPSGVVSILDQNRAA